MFDCSYYGKFVRPWRTFHPECLQKQEAEQREAAEREREELSQLNEVVASLAALASGTDEIEGAEMLKHFDPQQAWKMFQGWIASFAAPGYVKVPEDRDEEIAGELIRNYNLDANRLPNHLWSRFGQLCVLRDLADGKMTDRVKINGELPFLLEPNEKTVWVFTGTEYLEDKVVRRSSRSYGGVSMRVVPGLYVHSGQGVAPAASEGFVPIDKGMLVVTNKALLFRGDHKAFRIAYKTLAEVERVDYGFMAAKKTQSSRKFGFELPSGTDILPGFPHGLVSTLARLDAQNK